MSNLQCIIHTYMSSVEYTSKYTYTYSYLQQSQSSLLIPPLPLPPTFHSIHIHIITHPHPKPPSSHSKNGNTPPNPPTLSHLPFPVYHTQYTYHLFLILILISRKGTNRSSTKYPILQYIYKKYIHVGVISHIHYTHIYTHAHTCIYIHSIHSTQYPTLLYIYTYPPSTTL